MRGRPTRETDRRAEAKLPKELADILAEPADKRDKKKLRRSATTASQSAGVEGDWTPRSPT